MAFTALDRKADVTLENIESETLRFSGVEQNKNLIFATLSDKCGCCVNDQHKRTVVLQKVPCVESERERIALPKFWRKWKLESKWEIEGPFCDWFTGKSKRTSLRECSNRRSKLRPQTSFQGGSGKGAGKARVAWSNGTYSPTIRQNLFDFIIQLKCIAEICWADVLSRLIPSRITGEEMDISVDLEWQRHGIFKTIITLLVIEKMIRDATVEDKSFQSVFRMAKTWSIIRE